MNDFSTSNESLKSTLMDLLLLEIEVCIRLRTMYRDYSDQQLGFLLAEAERRSNFHFLLISETLRHLDDH